MMGERSMWVSVAFGVVLVATMAHAQVGIYRHRHHG
jgi:hypothetical protein